MEQAINKVVNTARASSRSLKIKVMSFLAIIFLLITLLFVFIAFQSVRTTEVRAWDQYRSDTLDNSVSTLTLFFHHVEDTLEYIGTLSANQLQAEPELIGKIQDNSDEFVEIVRFNNEGRIVGSIASETSLLSNVFTVTQSNWFNSATQGHTYLSDVEISPDNEPYMIISVPASDGGVVAGRLRLHILWDLVKDIRFGDTGQAYIINQFGTIIAHPTPEIATSHLNINDSEDMEKFLQNPEVGWEGNYSNFMNESVLGAGQWIVETNWLLVTEIGRAEAYSSSTNTLIILTISIFFFISLVMSIATRGMERLILWPITELNDGASHIGRGELEFRVDLKREDEIGQLAIAFNQMAASIGEREEELHENAMALSNEVQERRQAQEALDTLNRTLEKRIGERTAELFETNQKLQHQALHDDLTDLPNRTLIMDRLQHAIDRKQRNDEFDFAVIFLDLDRFKIINDSLGHNIGDLLLVEVAERLQQQMRSVDTVARLGGDEFVILLEDLKGDQAVEHVASRILNVLSQPITLAGHEITNTASLGVVHSSQRSHKPEDYLRDADIAMYHAKALGKSRYAVFSTSLRQHALFRLTIEQDLRKAIENHEFSLHYQPVTALDSGQITGFEALIRWNHPKQGQIAPGAFIPLAEETGLILLIGEWVLEEACKQIAEWHDRYPVYPPLSMNVNLSSRQLLQPELVNQIRHVLEINNLQGSSLNLEITEHTIIQDTHRVTGKLKDLKALGVSVQMDDFGTGYSSLGYLRNLPIDVIKIDRTFIDKMDPGQNKPGLVRSIIHMAQDLGIQVVAEGIERDDQKNMLTELGCDYGQGFYIAKPQAPNAIEALLSEILLVEDQK